jgi:hypothetical protein
MTTSRHGTTERVCESGNCNATHIGWARDAEHRILAGHALRSYNFEGSKSMPSTRILPLR